MLSPRRILAVAALVGAVGLTGGKSAQAAPSKKHNGSFMSLLANHSRGNNGNGNNGNHGNGNNGNHGNGNNGNGGGNNGNHGNGNGNGGGGSNPSGVTPAERQFIFAELKFLRVVEQSTLQLLRVERNLGLISQTQWFVQRTNVILNFVQKEAVLAAQLAGTAPFTPII